MRERVRCHRTHANRAATLVGLTVLLTSAVVALVVFGSGEAGAVQQVSCGDTITTDVTLHHNLVNCPNNGINIGADEVTLDLNYHTIDGDGKFFAPGCNPNKELCDVGVANLGYDGLTVVNGSLRQFFAGMDIERERHARVLGISASRNHLFGIGFFRASRTLVRNSSGNGSITPDGGTGIYLIASDHVRVRDSSFRDNGDWGIGVLDAAHNRIKGNRILGNTAAGVVMEGANRNRLRGNRMLRNSEGIIASGNGNVIARNRVFGALGGSGISFEGGHDNLIAQNVVVRAGRAGHGHRQSHTAGIRVGLIREQMGNGPRAVDTVVRRNRIKRTRKDGLLVESTAKHTLLNRNLARDAGGDGFGVDSRRTKLIRNRAVHNADLGIDAVRGVTDGGGNIARHNGDRRQCTHIACE
jgi:parallel beta-helix repeat protein